MSGIIKTLKNKINDIEKNVYPKTVLEAVVDSDTNKTLDVILDEMNDKIDNIEISGGGDASNKVSKTGDTMTGALILEGGFDAKSEDTWLEQDYIVMQTREGKGQAGYWKFCTITTTQDNVGEPIKIYIAQINTFGELTIAFNNVSTIIDCDVAYIRQTGNIPICYIKKTSGTEEACTFDVFATKSNIWDALTVTRFDMSWYIKQGVKLEWSDTFIDTLPDGVIASSRYNEEDRETFYALGGVNTVGDINAGGNLQQSLFSEHPENGLYPVPTSGGWDTAGVGNLFQDLSVAKTFLGSYSGAIDSEGHENTWHNVISVRHRNGVSDGNSYGMYIRSQLTNDQSLVYNKQYNGTWKGEKTILDSANYANYALPLTGGTVTGVTNFNQAINLPKGHLVTSFASGGGDNGYVKFAVFTCYSHATYAGSPMSFRMTTRGATGIVHLNIYNSATAGQGFVGYITQTGNIPQCYMIQSSTGVFELYAAKSPWDWISITDFVFPQYQQDRMTVTWTDTFVSSLPSGVTAATVTNEWSGVVTAADESGSVSFTMKAGCSYLISVRHITQGTMFATGIIVATPSSWSYYSIGVGGSAFHSISGSTFTYGFGSSSNLAKGKVQLKYIEIY